MGCPPPRRDDRIVQHHRRHLEVGEEGNSGPEQDRSQADGDLVEEAQVKALLRDGRRE